MSELKPLGLRCQWTQPGGYPQCRLLLAHEGDHEYYEKPRPDPDLPNPGRRENGRPS